MSRVDERDLGSAEAANPVLILGASTRAAAHSARRAGWRPICADRFADFDLRAVARVIPVSHYPRGLIPAAASAPQCPWMYTGALENHPRLIAAVSAKRPLWGNGAGVVRRVRDPDRVRRWLVAAGLPALSVLPSAAPPPADGGWLIKPLRSAAGRGIRTWDGTPLREPHYFQRRIAGQPMSAVFVAAGGDARLIGTARQLLHENGTNPWQYTGSIGPIKAGEPIQRQVRTIGRILARRGGLGGLFGIDFVDDGENAWLVEINPRYTASVEVHEHALGIPLFDWHVRACRDGRLGPWERGEPGTQDAVGRIVGKMVVYADRDLRVPQLQSPFPEGCPSDRVDGGRWALPPLADVPAVGTRVPAGQPVCTVLAAAERESDCRLMLAERAALLRRLLN